jgi:polysaccharide export outer membrane protein
MGTANKCIHPGLLTAALLLAGAGLAAAQQMPSSGPQQSVNPAAAGRSLPASLSGSLRNSSLSPVPADFAALKLGPGFLLSLEVLDDPDFQGSFRVDQQGNLALPEIGELHVGGETASEARADIQKKLRDDQILKDPQVNLTVIEYAAPEVTLVGEVTIPGKYPLLVPHPLTEVLALGGGLTAAAGNQVEILHGGGGAPEAVRYSKATEPRSAADVMVSPGDTVQVKRAGIVYVLGAVTRPGGYVMQEDGTLTALEALSMANGTTVQAQVGTIYLLRRNPDGTAVKIALPLNKMQRGKDADLVLQAADVLYVPVDKIKATLLNATGILAAATSASIYATAVY